MHRQKENEKAKSIDDDKLKESGHPRWKDGKMARSKRLMKLCLRMRILWSRSSMTKHDKGLWWNTWEKDIKEGRAYLCRMSVNGPKISTEM